MQADLNVCSGHHQIFLCFSIMCIYSRHKLLFLTHLSRMKFPSIINWTSPFPMLGLLGGIFHFYSNFDRAFC